MNSALFHMARPGDIRDEGTRGRGGGPGMREAAAVAKEMGFSQEFGPQVRYVSPALCHYLYIFVPLCLAAAIQHQFGRNYKDRYNIKIHAKQILCLSPNWTRI